MKRTMKLSDIIIRECFKETVPNPNKVQICRDYWNLNHEQDRYIVIDRNNVLVDGYIQYIVLQENGVEEAEIRIGKSKKLNRWHRKTKEEDLWDIPTYRDNPTTYIIGVHPNNTDRRFIWRIPSKWTNVAENLHIDDMVQCRTKSGISTVIVKEIQVLDKAPVDYPIKKMCSKKIKRDGKIIRIGE